MKKQRGLMLYKRAETKKADGPKGGEVGPGTS